VTSVHQRLAEAVLLLGIVGTLWAAGSIVLRRPSPGLRVYVILSEGVVGLQALLGIGLAIAGHRPHDSLHFVYGPAVLLSLPVAMFLGRRMEERGEHLALLGGCTAVVLLSIRAIQTGGG